MRTRHPTPAITPGRHRHVGTAPLQHMFGWAAVGTESIDVRFIASDARIRRIARIGESAFVYPTPRPSGRRAIVECDRPGPRRNAGRSDAGGEPACPPCPSPTSATLIRRSGHGKAHRKRSFDAGVEPRRPAGDGLQHGDRRRPRIVRIPTAGERRQHPGLCAARRHREPGLRIGQWPRRRQAGQDPRLLPVCQRQQRPRRRRLHQRALQRLRPDRQWLHHRVRFGERGRARRRALRLELRLRHLSHDHRGVRAPCDVRREYLRHHQQRAVHHSKLIAGRRLAWRPGRPGATATRAVACRACAGTSPAGPATRTRPPNRGPDCRSGCIRRRT